MLGCAGIVIAMMLILWNATGRATYTQFYDTERAQREAETTNNLETLFERDTPTGTSVGEVPNRFMLGLLPSTYPWNITDPAIISVLTISTPAAVIVLLHLAPSAARRIGASRRAATANRKEQP